MSRRNPTEGLDVLINDYKSFKDAESSAKKEAGKLGDEIKDTMSKANITEAESDKWVAKIATTQKEDFNEDKAIEILKENLSPEDLTKVVKSKEYIDDDALESLVYNNQFDINLLTPCRTPGKVVTTLRINKKK